MATTSKGSKSKGTNNVEPTPAVEPAPVVIESIVSPGAMTEAERIAEESAAANAAETARKVAIATAALSAKLDKIGKDWADHDSQSREWMYIAGEQIEAYANDYTAFHGSSKRKDAIESACDVILATTGEDYSKDVSRAVGIYSAAIAFGRSIVKRLPLSAQKGLGMLADRIEANGTVSYVVSIKIVKESNQLAALAVCDVPDAPQHIRDALPRGKDGIANGIGVYNLAALLNKYRKDDKGIVGNPWTIPATTPPATTPPATTPPFPEGKGTDWTDDQDKAEQEELANLEDKDDRDSGEMTPKLRGEQNATGMRPESSAIALDIKPNIAATQLMDMLEKHEERDVILFDMVQMTKNPVALISPMLVALGDMGDDGAKYLNILALLCKKEAQIATYLAIHPKLTREDAVKALASKK